MRGATLLLGDPAAEYVEVLRECRRGPAGVVEWEAQEALAGVQLRANNDE